MAGFTYEVKQHIATLSGTAGRSCEVNIISYSNGTPKLDIRRWREINGEKRMERGICLTNEEVVLLRDALNELEEGGIV